MNQIGNFALGLLIGILGLYGMMHYTVVQAKDGFHFVPKLAPKLENPYADVRHFRLQHWQQHQSLALAVVRAEKGYLLNDPTLLTFRESVQNVLSRYQTQTPAAVTQGSVQDSVATSQGHTSQPTYTADQRFHYGMGTASN